MQFPDYVSWNLKFRRRDLLFFLFIVNARQRESLFEIQTMVTKSERKMLMEVRTSDFRAVWEKNRPTFDSNLTEVS